MYNHRFDIEKAQAIEFKKIYAEALVKFERLVFSDNFKYIRVFDNKRNFIVFIDGNYRTIEYHTDLSDLIGMLLSRKTMHVIFTCDRNILIDVDKYTDEVHFEFKLEGTDIYEVLKKRFYTGLTLEETEKNTEKLLGLFPDIEPNSGKHFKLFFEVYRSGKIDTVEENLEGLNLGD